jgi:hypothetical protein
MALLSGKKSLTQTEFILSDTDVDEVGVDDVFGGAGSVRGLHFENTHGATAAHFKAYDNPNPVIGTTSPDLIIHLPPDTQTVWFVTDGLPFTNLSYACVQEDGTSGTTAPAAAAKLYAVVR